MSDVQPDARSIRRMLRRLARDGLRLPEPLATPLAVALATPGDRDTMLEAAAGAATSLKQAGHAVTPDLMLEAAAALRGDRDWNALSGRLPKAVKVGAPQSDDAVLWKVREATTWLVHHAHHQSGAGGAPLCTGPFPSEEQAAAEFESYSQNHPSHIYRLLHWTGPQFLLETTARTFQPGRLLLEAERGTASINVLRQRRGDGLELGADWTPEVGGSSRWNSKVPPSLSAMQQAGLLTEGVANLLRQAVASHHRILVMGATAQGKTLLLNALAEAVPSEEPLYTVEQLPEIIFDETHQVTRSGELPSLTSESRNGGWVLDHAVPSQWMRAALDASSRAIGSLFGTYGFPPRIPFERDDMRDEVKSWHRPGASPELDLIICLDRFRGHQPHQWVSSCWVLSSDWSMNLVVMDGEVLGLQALNQGIKS